MAAKRKSSLVSIVSNSSPAGIIGFMSSHTFVMRAFTSVALAPGDWKIISIVPASPLMLERLV